MSIRIERLLRTGSAKRVRISYGTALGAVAAVAAVFAGARFYGPVIAAPLTSATSVTAARSVQSAEIHHSAVIARHSSRVLVRQTHTPVLPTATPQIVAVQTPAPRPAKSATHPPTHRLPAPARSARAHAASTIDPRAPHCDGCNLEGINWRGRDLRGIVLHGANLANADLRDADLRGADLSGSNVDGALWQGARLQGARLDGLNVTTDGMDIATLRTLLDMCAGCNFGTFDGRGKNLSGLHLSGLNLADADLREADLRNTTFDGVNLSGVRLQGAKLDGAAFNGCNFSGVDLRGVDMSGAKITGSNISGTIVQ
jgi:uncharacterized protein YjbI with pentapeptide repeats